MKIRKGCDAGYQAWHAKTLANPKKRFLIKLVVTYTNCLDDPEVPVLGVVERLANLAMMKNDRGYIALVISLFHERGRDFRFQWNKFWKGEEFALRMELLENKKPGSGRVWDP
ncbi:MAG: hypothetical protein A3B16_02290 [Candidatus Zambryskibacteria bacterium RIFCSPLOWO2_01_FULL_45_43]|uniref:Uncharacterized protein n=1 Tax=Candidatus Zambryskibacteria bacterium RIFCSPLOWO2_01_FULL_45_43 TaxID=1802762 RepID=A0A1G2U9E2_9BACT|nr:MAG: hypothetical protein A3B16_02290 [Candidatus Zambryskibacteria bacterium RIFCSPLOWO2_01_FULL_45_43]